ncbi:UbiH/UbiF/VisC/COQ6 family ubiquinone biosynthesis hydroxylase [Cellvibrio polysaccharolyticus]|uniref:2-octaprenyl-3-methyl-6-methoxy-1,4-benzoquinol hydroxylase n=1 Tax=Cellvibrio polysaccharolyticus TaxID=2082724 RepID=A0A928V1M6_9GAMM|nr:UbiH/UbiF/VisC/COQ6 family ubiquinone biosynthesis hydroxylase [Cellvibrio polysaccharolyticus]MBE8716148.1 2-octaprenyl-3-methyl-6-methoxy-1,4-benzoquinol hydroxylase [Cellvibrio polysaccharolyticus]
MQPTYDVIIAGAGMNGAAMACAIARLPEAASLRIAVIDAAPAAADYQGDVFDPRVVALTPRSDQLLSLLDCWDNILNERACVYTDMAVWDGEGNAGIQFACDEVRLPYLGHIVENSVVVRALHAQMQACSNIEFLHPVRLVSLQKSDPTRGEAFTRITLDDGRELVTRLLIAADGAQSGVRDMAGFATREWDYQQQAIVTTVAVSQSHQFTAWQRFTSRGPLAFLPLRNGNNSRYCSIVWSADSDLATDLMALSDDAFCAALGRAFEYRLGEVQSVVERYCIPLRQRHAQQYFQPGIVLIGDAAHSIHPLAGQGVNLGFQDVVALAAEIERALQRGIPLQDLSILRRYQRQRLADNLTMMTAMEGFKRLFGQKSPGVTWLRNTGLRMFATVPLLKKFIVRQVTG